MSGLSLWKRLISIQISGASLSTVASSFIAVSIVRSDGGINSPYRRIIFGMSVSDILQSLSLAVGPFAVPSTVPQGLWAVGNYHTCQVNGFAYNMGAGCTPMYMFALCLYTVLKINGNMTNQVFAKKVEKPMHLFIILFNLSSNIAGLFSKTINSTVLGGFCSHSAFPAGCRQYPEIFGECKPTIARKSAVLNLLFNVGQPFFCLFGIVACMGLICWHVIRRDRLIFGPSSSTTHSSPTTMYASDVGDLPREIPDEEEVPIGGIHNMEQSSHQTENFSPVSMLELSANSSIGPPARSLPLTSKSMTANMKVRERQVSMRRIYLRQIILQAFWFVMAYLSTQMCWTAMSTIFLTGQAPTELLLYFSACLYPIGGVFNFLVYTRPEVSKLRIRYPDEYSYLQALWLVIKAGGVTLVTSGASPGTPVTSDKQYGTGEAFHAQEVEQKQIQSSVGCQYHGSDSSMDRDNFAYRSRDEWSYNNKWSGTNLNSGLGIIKEIESSLSCEQHDEQEKNIISISSSSSLRSPSTHLDLQGREQLQQEITDEEKPNNGAVRVERAYARALERINKLKE